MPNLQSSVTAIRDLTMTAPRPSCRQDFEVAIICALPLEYNAVTLQFDEFWSKHGDPFGRAVGDPNTYTTGRIGKHNVVLALLSHMGKVNAAAATASMRSSYSAVKLVLLTGICGGAPYYGHNEILLGDVVISNTVIQHDLGSRYPGGFIRKDTTNANLNKHDRNVRNFLALFDTDSGRVALGERTAHYLRQLQIKDGRHLTKYTYPGTVEDKLFEPSYRHMHHNSPTCICKDYGRLDPVCDEALKLLCDDLGCDERYLEPRERLIVSRKLERVNEGEEHKPAVHMGAIASGDTVMKSGADRDRIVKKEGVIAFDMEGAGVWEELPCIVVKGVSDYADCHKNKKWQAFAAATAASAATAILERYSLTDRHQVHAVEKSRPGHFLVPFGRNQSFVGREAILLKLLERIWPGTNKDDCQRSAIEGLGGVGKTQIALEAVYRVRDKHPDCSIFWVPVVDATSFEKAYRDIGIQMEIEGIDEDRADIKRLVKAALSDANNGSWLLVVDNADDLDLLFGAASLLNYLPFSRMGSILFTTRNHEAAVRLVFPYSAIIPIAEMDGNEALDLLRKGLKQNQTSDTKDTKRLLEILAHLPLAIRQASAYMAKKQISTSEYLELCESEHKDMVYLLSRDFDDPHRYQQFQNPVATTWLISFNHILKHNQLAAEYLKFMSLLAEKDIPRSLLPAARRIEAMEAIGTLKAYAFIGQREGQDSFDIHRLVRLAMQNWLEKKGELHGQITSAIKRLEQSVPFPEQENRDMWIKYLPHATAVLKLRELSAGRKTNARLLGKVITRNSVPWVLRLYRKVLGRGYEYSTSKKVEASVFANISWSYYKLGQYQRAEQMYRTALELRKAALGRDHPDTLTTFNNLALMLQSLGNYEEAEQIYLQTLQLNKKVRGKNHLSTLTTMNNLAGVFDTLGKYEQAEQMHRETLYLYQIVRGRDHPDTLTSMNNLAGALHSLGKYKEAEQLHWQTLLLRERVQGKDHLDTLTSMNNLALVFQSLGKYHEAEKMHRQEWKLMEKAVGKAHPDTLSSTNNLANVLIFLGKYEEAEHMHRQTIETREKFLGKDHPDTLDSINALAVIFENMGAYKMAEQSQKEALIGYKKVFGNSHPRTLSSIDHLGVLLRNQGKYEEAEQMHQQTLRIRMQALGKNHPDTFSSMHNLACVLNALGRYGQAEKMHRQTLELCEEWLGQRHPSTLDSMNGLAIVLNNLEKYEEAEHIQLQMLDFCERVLGKKHPRSVSGTDHLGVVLRNLGKYEEALQIHRQTREIREEVLGKDHPDTLSSMHNLALVLLDLERYEEAELLYRQTLELRETKLGQDHPSTRKSGRNLEYCIRARCDSGIKSVPPLQGKLQL